MACTYGLGKTIDFLVRRQSKNGNAGHPACQAYDAIETVNERMREYHDENRQVLRDIRDGSNTHKENARTLVEIRDGIRDIARASTRRREDFEQ
jgi:hypothetical protein